MKNLEASYKIDELYSLFLKAVDNTDNQIINNCLKSIELTEKLFLNNYDNRKKEGVFYTNYEVAKFITLEAILLYLKKKLKINKLEKIDDIYKLDSQTKSKICECLLKVSILDPACGSGIFLLSAASLIYEIIKKLNPEISYSYLTSQILKSLHGIDINDSAKKLSILKLFLWFYQKKELDSSIILSILTSNIKNENSILTSSFSKFDIVIGNPPYGNILTKHEKEILKKEKIFNKDVYCSFLLKALEWNSGIIGFLVPKSFLLRQGYIQFRNKLLTSANLLEIYDIGPNLFRKATNEVQIILYENKDSINKNLQIYDYSRTEIISYSDQNVDQLRVCFNSKCPLCKNSKKIYVYTFNKNCPYCYSKTINLNRIRIKPTKFLLEIIDKIEKKGNLNYLNPVDFPKMVRGEEDKGLRQIRQKLKNNITESCIFISAKDDFKYYYIRKNKSFKIEEISAKALKGYNYEYYTSPKLLIKHNNIIPEAIFTKDKVCFTSSIYSLLHENNTELKYLCAVLNSTLIQFYCKYGINNQKDTTINLNQYMIRHLPIINVNEDVKISISTKVDKIIYNLKNRNGVMDKETRALLKEIDLKFFDLYSLTEQERQIIISNVKNNLSGL